MVVNVSVPYNGGLLPNIILLTQCYYHRGTRLNATKQFCICSPMLPNFDGMVSVENVSFLDLVYVACWTDFLSVVWHSWRIFSKHGIQKVGGTILLTLAMI